MMILTIAGRELRSLFLSPLAWAMLAVLQFLMAYMFLAQLDNYLTLQPHIAGMEDLPGVTEMIATPLFSVAAIILLLITPLITMRLICEERRNQTLSLLFSAPVSMTEIALGKFLGVFSFFLLIILLVLLMPLSLLAGGALDLGKLAACAFGLLLLMTSFSAIGLYLSAVATQPTVAAITTFGVLLLLWIMDWSGGNKASVRGVVEYLSMQKHYSGLLKGLINTTDVCYFIILTVIFLVLTIHRLDNDRLQK